MKYRPLWSRLVSMNWCRLSRKASRFTAPLPLRHRLDGGAAPAGEDGAGVVKAPRRVFWNSAHFVIQLPKLHGCRHLRLGLGLQGGAGLSCQRMSFAAIIHQELSVMIQLVSHAGAQGA
jgi:hypothetical protein